MSLIQELLCNPTVKRCGFRFFFNLFSFSFKLDIYGESTLPVVPVIDV